MTVRMTRLATWEYRADYSPLHRLGLRYRGVCHMNPWWLLMIVPGSILVGAIGLVLTMWFTRNIFPTLFVGDDF